jgi:hypothetical protein
MGNGLSITGLSVGFDLAASNFSADAPMMFFRGSSVSKAAAALPATTTGNLFTITGGRILLTGIVGEVTTVIQTQACNTKVVFDPTATGSNVDLCANLDITGAVVGSFFTITGTAATAMQNGLAVVGMTIPWVLQPGAVALTTAATNSGQVKWKMWYMPIDSGVTVAAA